jgi:hypothetical protein
MATSVSDDIGLENLLCLAIAMPANDTTGLPPSTAVTNSATAVSADGTSLTLSAAPSGVVRGNTFTFGTVTPVTVVASGPAVGAVVPIYPSPGAIASSATGTRIAYQAIPGGSQAGFDGGNNMYKIRSFEDGLYSRNRKTEITGQISWSGFFPKTPRVIRDVIIPAFTSNSELYVSLRYPSGDIREMIALVDSYKETAQLDQSLLCSWNFMAQGEFLFINAA